MFEKDSYERTLQDNQEKIAFWINQYKAMKKFALYAAVGGGVLGYFLGSCNSICDKEHTSAEKSANVKTEIVAPK